MGDFIYIIKSFRDDFYTNDKKLYNELDNESNIMLLFNSKITNNINETNVIYEDVIFKYLSKITNIESINIRHKCMSDYIMNLIIKVQKCKIEKLEKINYVISCKNQLISNIVKYIEEDKLDTKLSEII